MRVLFFSNVFPNSINPTKGTFNLSLVKALSRLDAVRVVSPVSWVDEFVARTRGGEAVQRSTTPSANVQAEYPRYYYPPKVSRNSYGKFLSWSVHHTMLEQMEAFQPEAIVSYWAHPDGEVAVQAARRAGIPAVVMVGGSDVLLLARNGRRRQAILNVLHSADAVVAVSEHIAARLRQDGIPADKLHVIRRGVDRNVFTPGDRDAARSRLGVSTDRTLLVAVGRLVPVKGFDVLIDACRQLVAKNVNVDCHLLGGGPLAQTLGRQINELGLGDRVFIRGPQRQTDLADWYRAADLTVLSSHSEGVPNVLLESIACGTPFVATDVGGVSEIADTACHTLVPAGDAARMADGIAARLRKTDRCSLTPRFVPLSWETSAERLNEVIRGCREPLGSNPATAEALLAESFADVAGCR